MEITDKSLFIEQFGKVAACHVVPNKSTNNYPIVFVHGAWGGKYQSVITPTILNKSSNRLDPAT